MGMKIKQKLLTTKKLMHNAYPLTKTYLLEEITLNLKRIKTKAMNKKYSNTKELNLLSRKTARMSRVVKGLKILSFGLSLPGEKFKFVIMKIQPLETISALRDTQSWT